MQCILGPGKLSWACYIEFYGTGINSCSSSNGNIFLIVLYQWEDIYGKRLDMTEHPHLTWL